MLQEYLDLCANASASDVEGEDAWTDADLRFRIAHPAAETVVLLAGSESSVCSALILGDDESVSVATGT